MKSRPDVIPEQEKTMEYKLKASRLRSLNESTDNKNTLEEEHEDEIKNDNNKISNEEVIEYIPGEQMLGSDSPNSASVQDEVAEPIEHSIKLHNKTFTNHDSNDQESIDRIQSLKVGSVAPYSEIDLVPKKDIIHQQQRSPRDSVIYEPVVDVHSGYSQPNPELVADNKHYQGIYLQPIDGGCVMHAQNDIDRTASVLKPESKRVDSSQSVDDDDDYDYEEVKIEPKENSIPHQE